MMALQVAADIGGTFTDLVFRFPDGTLDKCKVPTTPQDFGRAIVEGVLRYLLQRGLTASAVTEVLHATTVATNAILERSGSKVALITTEGFRDVLELRRIRIPLSYDLSWTDEAAPSDEVITDKGVTVLIDRKATLFLIGTVMDYEVKAMTSGFTFTNPNEKGRCACA